MKTQISTVNTSVARIHIKPEFTLQTNRRLADLAVINSTSSALSIRFEIVPVCAEKAMNIAYAALAELIAGKTNSSLGYELVVVIDFTADADVACNTGRTV